MSLRSLLILLACASLAACGFQLKGAYPLAFATLYIGLPETAELHAMIRRSIEASSPTHIVHEARDAEAVLSVLSDVPQKNILSLNASGRAREYQLVRSFSFRLSDQAGGELIPPSLITIKRDITFNDAQVLAKEQEEAFLWRDMQNDLVQQLLRRLATAKSKAQAKVKAG